jgi:hypothetical protein
VMKDGSTAARHPRPARHAPANQVTDAPSGPRSLPQQSEHLNTQSVLALQRRAGNSSVNRLLRTVQRAPLGRDDDPEGYTSELGKANVAGSATTRREVRGLAYGLSGGFQRKYKSKKHPDGVASSEHSMTKESPENMAVVIMPDKVVATRQVQVILHFHGFGFRGWDPYAGYTVASGYKRGGTEIKKGSVRDVDQEHWAQQIGAVNKERGGSSGPQIVAILAQGRGMSDFGNVPTFDYVQDVLTRVPELKNVTQYSITLSAHSGGGFQVASKVGRGEARTADRTAVPAPKAGKAAAQPADLVVLFDAEGVGSVTAWVTGQIQALAKTLKAASSPADAQAAITATPKFRGYFAEKGSYAKAYTNQNELLWKALAKVPAPWAYPDPANPGRVTVADLFRFIPVSGADHEHVISGGTGHPAEQGALADALRASADPTSDRAKGLEPKSKQKQSPGTSGTPAKPKPAVKTSQGAPAPTLSAPTASAPTASAPTVSAPVAAPTPGWRRSDATKDYAFTEADKQALASQTPEERAQDKAALTKTAIARLKALTKAEKKGTLDDAETTELATLRELQARVGAAQGALKRKDVEDVLAVAGHTVADWYGQIQRGSFLNLTLRVHRALAERLTQAETALVADPKVNPDQVKAAELGEKLGMYASTSDLRRPKAATGGSNLSMHTFGLAVDLNYKGNPFLGNASRRAPDIVKRATGLVEGQPVDLMKYIGEPKEAYATLKSASAALQTYLSYQDPAKSKELDDKIAKHTKVKGEPADAAGWLVQIAKDAKSLEGGDFRGHKAAEEGFIDFDEAVVLALTGAGLTWGGTYAKAKDIMHFDLREGTGATVDAARKGHRNNK